MKGDTISRSAAVKQILEEAAFIIRHDNGEDYKTGIGAGFKKAADMLENAPTVDTAPVVHGRWIKNQNEAINPFGGIEPILIDTFQCSVCGVHFDIGESRHYCPNCGARMDGGAGE